MLDYNTLADNIINKIKNKKTQLQCQNILSQQITKYIINNLQIFGIYTGFLPIGTPDPLSGLVEFKVINCFIDSNILILNSKKNFETWYQSILKQIKLTTMVVNSLNGVLLNIPSKIFLQINPSIFSRHSEFEDSWKIICKNIVNDLKRSIINNIPISAISSSGGTGTVVITKTI